MTRARGKNREISLPSLSLTQLVIGLTLLIVLGVSMQHLDFTGSFTADSSSYSSTINETYFESTTFKWTPEVNGSIRSLTLDGKLYGEGYVNVYLETPHQKILILNSSYSESPGLDAITGLVIGEELETVLEYADNPEFDTDNNGIEDIEGAIDYTIENSVVPEDANLDYMCVIWDTYSSDNNESTLSCTGSGECCSLAGLASISPLWNESFVTFVGRYGATQNNEISARVVYGEVISENNTIFTDIRYADWQTLPANFTNITKPTQVFESKCIDSCLIDFLNSTDYNITIEVYESQFELETLSYVLIPSTVNASSEITTQLNATTTKDVIWNKTITAQGDIPRIYTVLPENVSIIDVTKIINANPRNVPGTRIILRPGQGKQDLEVREDLEVGEKLEILYSTPKPEISITENDSIWVEVSSQVSYVNVTASIPVDRQGPLTAAITSYINGSAQAENFTYYFQNNSLYWIIPQVKENIFEISLERINANITSVSSGQRPAFTLELQDKQTLVNKNLWREEYEVYETNKKDFNDLPAVSRAKGRIYAAQDKEKQNRNWTDTSEKISPRVKIENEIVEIDTIEITKLREGLFNVSLDSNRFRPGKYTISFDIELNGQEFTIEQNFTWGVLALNTHKSVYLEDETAFIGIGVLDDLGRIVCDANVTLDITGPLGTSRLSTGEGTIFVSDECEFLGVTQLPDYYTSYEFGETGSYVFNLTANTSNGQRFISEPISVVESVDYDVSRLGPTRIYPAVLYNMTFGITANRPFVGTITESIPSVFEIIPQDGMQIEIGNDTTLISWDVRLQRGDSINLTYSMDPPDISPEYYLLGPLSIGSWEEYRQWQIANDKTYDLTDDAITVNETGTAEFGEQRNVTSDLAVTVGNGNTGDTWTLALNATTEGKQTAVTVSDSCGTNPFKIVNIVTGCGSSVVCTAGSTDVAIDASAQGSNGVYDQKIHWIVESCGSFTSLDWNFTNIRTDASGAGAVLNDYSDTVLVETPPSSINITFYDPTPADGFAITDRNYTLINLTVNATQPVNAMFIEWNLTNYSIMGGDLIGHWNFDNNVDDSSGFESDGSITGTVDCSANGYFGNACDFAGTDDYVSIGTSSLYQMNDEFTLMAWINPDTFGDGEVGRIIDRGDFDSTPVGWTFAIDGRTGVNQLTFAHNINGDWDPLASNTQVISTGTWQHVTATYDNGAVVLYVNGTQVGSGDIGTFNVGASDLRFGVRNDDLRDFDGRIDDIRIYKRALTGDEIRFWYDKYIGEYFINFTNQINGTYDYKVYANVTGGGNNTTETRTLYFGEGSIYPGNLSVSEQTLDFNVTQYSLISFNVTALCSNGDCNQVNATTYFNWTGPIDTLVNITPTNYPVHNVTSLLNQSFESVTEDTEISYNVTLNISSEAETYWQFTVNFTGETTINGSSVIRVNVTQTPLDCQDLNSEGENYLLTDNIASTGNCFTVSAENIVLDCNGYTITYATSQSGNAIISNSNGTTIKNCNLVTYNDQNSSAIVLNSNNSVLINNNINVTSNASFGINANALRTNITSNMINVSGNYSQGIGLYNSELSNLSGNIITTKHGTKGYGINISSSSNTLVKSNTISTGYSGTNNNYGIYIYFSDYNKLLENTIASNGTSAPYAIYIDQSDFSNISENTISTDGTSNTNGISLNFADYTNITYNTIFNVISNEGASIQTGSFVNGEVIMHNTLNGSNYALDIQSTQGVIMYNRIISYGKNGAAIRIFANDNNVSFNTIETNQTAIHYGTSSLSRSNISYNDIIFNASTQDISIINGVGNSDVDFRNNNITTDRSIAGKYKLFSAINNANGYKIIGNRFNIFSNSSIGIELSNMNRSNITENIFLIPAEFNSSYAISLIESSVNNTIYNNIFNTTYDPINLTTTEPNNFSITLESNTNIISGNSIGGNFYDNSTEGSTERYSVNCTDVNGDSVCDNSRSFSSQNIDFYPLSDETAVLSVCIVGESCYSTITLAINNANDGDTIHINGATTLTESINVYKKVTITTESGSRATLIGQSPAITINANATIIENINVNNTNGPAIWINHSSHVIIRNISANVTASSVAVINSTGSSDSVNINNTITNSELISTGNTGAKVVHFLYTNYSEINNSIIVANATSSDNYALYLQLSAENNISTNVIRNNGSSNNYAVYLFEGSTNNRLNRNNITAHGTGSTNYALYLNGVSGSSSNNITNNIISVDAVDSVYGLYIVGSSDIKAYYNTIIVNGSSTDNYALYLQSSANDNIIENNTLRSDGQDYNIATHIASNSLRNTINNNTISSNGGLDSYGIYLYSNSSDNSIVRNIITTYSTEENNHAIFSEVSNLRNNITNNTITVLANSSHAIKLMQTNETLITENIIKVTGNFSSAIQLRSSGTSNTNGSIIYNNVFNTTYDPVNITNTGINNFSTTLIQNTNIVNGSYLGGNFYDNSTEGSINRYSIGCTDADEDSICDNSLVFASNNIDYYPLTEPAAIIGPDYSFTEYILGTSSIDDATGYSYQKLSFNDGDSWHLCWLNQSGNPEISCANSSDGTAWSLRNLDTDSDHAEIGSYITLDYKEINGRDIVFFSTGGGFSATSYQAHRYEILANDTWNQTHSVDVDIGSYSAGFFRNSLVSDDNTWVGQGQQDNNWYVANSSAQDTGDSWVGTFNTAGSTNHFNSVGGSGFRPKSLQVGSCDILTVYSDSSDLDLNTEKFTCSDNSFSGNSEIRDNLASVHNYDFVRMNESGTFSYHLIYQNASGGLSHMESSGTTSFSPVANLVTSEIKFNGGVSLTVDEENDYLYVFYLVNDSVTKTHVAYQYYDGSTWSGETNLSTTDNVKNHITSPELLRSNSIVVHYTNGTSNYNIMAGFMQLPISAGLLDIQSSMADSINVTQNDTFDITVTAYCDEGLCGDINVTTYYNATDAIDTPISIVTLDTPMFNSTGLLNQTRDQLDNSESFEYTVTINATGEPGTFYALTVNYTNGTHTNGSSTFIINISSALPDVEAPQVAIFIPTNNVNLSGISSVNVSINDSTGVETANISILQPDIVYAGPYALSLISGTDAEGIWNYTLDTTQFSDGTYNLSVNTTDVNGYLNTSQNVTVVFDNTLANISSGGLNSTTFRDDQITISIDINDSQTGISSVYYSLVGDSQTSWFELSRSSGDISSGTYETIVESTDFSNGNYNITINATDYAGNSRLQNVSDITIDNIISYGKPLFISEFKSSQYSGQRKLFWDGDNWYATYLATGGFGYNYSKDLQTWNNGSQKSYGSADSGSRSSVVFRHINGFKTYAAFIQVTGDRNTFYFTRGNILSDGSMNETHSLAIGTSGQTGFNQYSSSGHLSIDSDNYYWISPVDSTTFSVYSVNRSLGIDNGSSWINAGDFNSSGGSFGANGPNARIVPLENGVNMQFAVGDSTIYARNFTPEGYTYSSVTTIASNFDSSGSVDDDFDMIALNESGIQNVHLVYRANDNTVKHYVSDGSDRTDWTLINTINDSLPKLDGGIVLSRNESTMFMFFINTSSTFDRIMVRTYDGTNWSDAKTILQNAHTKDAITVSEVSNGTDIAVGYSVGDSSYNFTVVNYTHASAAPEVVNSAPEIINVTAPVVTPLENSTELEAYILFNVTDADGISDLDSTTAMVNVTLSDSYFKYNDTNNCEEEITGDTFILYNCTITIAYYDNSSAFWVINASVEDNSGLIGINTSQNMTINELSAFHIVEPQISTNANIFDTNTQMSFTFNNTGNFDFSTLNITPFDLNASITDIFKLDGNFSINATLSSEGFGSTLRNGTPIGINDSSGLINLTHRNPDGSGGLRTIYIYVDIPESITPGAIYNTSLGTTWQTFAE